MDLDIKDMHIAFVNLNYREDRLKHMHAELKRVDIQAERFNAFKYDEHFWHKDKTYFMNKTPGAIGCFYSQMDVLKQGLKKQKHTWVLEDDVIFCTDIHHRLQHINNFLKYQKKWDIFWLGATFHVNPARWHDKNHLQLPDCNCTLNRDAETTSDPNIMRTYGAWSTYSYIVNKNSIEKILNMLAEDMPNSIGIDFSFIRLQPRLFTFAFVPGCCKQMNNKSDIGTDITMFENFASMNGTKENSAYWWADKISNFDPSNFDWAETEIK